MISYNSGFTHLSFPRKRESTKRIDREQLFRLHHGHREARDLVHRCDQ